MFVCFPHDRLPLLGCSFPEACQCFGTVRSIDLAPLQTLTGNLHLDKGLVWFAAGNWRNCLPCQTRAEADN